MVSPTDMNVRQTVCSIVAAGVLALTATGCEKVDNTKYAYNYKIGDDWVHFNQGRLTNWGKSTLTVTKPDGRVIEYVDTKRNNETEPKIEYVAITKGTGDNKRTTQYNAQDAAPVLELGQTQFDKYLADILKAKVDEGMRDLQ